MPDISRPTASAQQKEGTTTHHNRHDTTFKLAMRDLRVAREMISNYLPKEITEKVNLNLLSVASSSYIEQDLKLSHADILYVTKTLSGDDTFVYFIWEHQSSYDKNIPFRLLRYTCNIMQDHLKSGHDTLPLVIPALLYNGENSPYPGSCDLFESFSDIELAKKHMFKPFTLIDLSVKTNQELAQSKWCALPNMLLKHIRARDFLSAVEDTLTSLIKFLYNAGGKSIAEDMLQCIARFTSIPDKGRLVRMVKKASHDAGERLMTLYEQLVGEGIEKGIKKGIDLGRQEGIDLGRQEGIDLGKRECIIRLLRNGMNQQQIAHMLETTVADVEAILAISGN